MLSKDSMRIVCKKNFITNRLGRRLFKFYLSVGYFTFESNGKIADNVRIGEFFWYFHCKTVFIRDDKYFRLA